MEGRLAVPMEKTVSSNMMQFTPEIVQQNHPPMIETFTSAPIWEELTGEKKGFIIKRDEVKKMKVVGYRCSLCNYIEIYAKS